MSEWFLGFDIQSSIIVTLMLKELEFHILYKSTNDIHAKVLYDWRRSCCISERTGERVANN